MSMVNYYFNWQGRVQDSPQEGAPILQGGGGAPTYDFAKVSEELHEIEKILGRSGAFPAPPLDPPLIEVSEHSRGPKNSVFSC